MGRVAPIPIDSVLSPEDDGSYPGSQGARLMDVVVWLRSLGLGKYEAAFRENDIDETAGQQWHPAASLGAAVTSR